MTNRYTLLIVDDSIEAQVLYRRYLIAETRYEYDIVGFNSGDKALEWCQQTHPDVILLDYLLPDTNGLQFLATLTEQSQRPLPPILVLTGNGDEMIAVEFMKRGIQDYVVKHKITPEGLRQAVHTLLERSRLVQELQQQQQQQRLLARISLQIHQSLHLNEILEQVVQGVQQLLQADRVMICQFQAGQKAAIVAEAVLPAWTPLLHTQIDSRELLNNGGSRRRQPQVQVVDNIAASDLTATYVQFLQQFQVQARLVVPILLEPQDEICLALNCEQQPTSSCLWGLLIVHHCHSSHAWQPFETELLHQLTTQLAIAIRQAELHQSVQALNASLEAKVQQRTVELQQVNRELKAEIANRKTIQKALQESQACLRLINAITSNQTKFRRVEEAVDHTLQLIHEYFPQMRIRYCTIDSQGKLQTNLSLQPSHQYDCTGMEFDLLQVPDYWAALKFGQPLAIPNIAQEARLDPIAPQLQQLNIQAMLAVPLKLSDQHLGLLSLTDEQVHPWSLYEVQTLAEIASFLSFTLQSVLVQEQRQLTEAALRESERKFRAIFDNTFQLTGLLTPGGTLLEINQTALSFSGLPRETVVNRLFWETDLWMPSPETQNQLQQAILQAARGEFVRSEVEIFGAGGQVATLDFSLRPLRDEADQVVLLILEGRDISERARLEAERNRAEQERDRLLQILEQQNHTLEEQVTQRTEALQQSEQKFRQLAENIHSAFWILNLDQREQIYVSPAYTEIWGRPCTNQQITPEIWVDSIHPDDRDRVISAIAKQLWGNFNEEYRILRPNGEVRWIHDRAFPIRNDQDTVYRIVGIAEDITDRKQAELEILQNRDLREAIFNESTDAIFLVDVVTGSTIDCNRRAIELFSATNQAALLNLANPVLQHCQFTAIDLQTMAQEITEKGYWSRELELQTCQGTPFWGNLAVKQIWVADRQINLVRITDISERKQSEMLLKAQQDFLRRLIDAVPNLIFVKNWEGYFTLVNQATADIYQTTIVDLVGKTDADFNPDQEEVEQFLAADREVMTTMTSRILEEVVTSATGQQRYFQTIKIPIVSVDGHSKEILGIATDITNRKQFEQQLRQSNEQLGRVNVELARATRLKDEFLASMSHELRTPLNAILGISEGLQEEVYGNLTERQLKALGTIEQSGKHLLELINDILDLAKIGSGKMELQIAPVSLDRLCHSSLTFVKQQALQKNISLSVTISQPQTSIAVDERRIRQALINLLSNAIKFTPTGGQVVLAAEVEPETQTLCLTVRDTGIGIAPEHMDKLFQAFVQIDSRLSRNYSGTGLGLALVRQIVERHGGSVAVTSQVNQGSCFTIRLSDLLPQSLANVDSSNPTESTRPIAPSTATALPVSPPTDHQCLILVAEDNLANIDTLAPYLTGQGYSLAIAHNGLEALKVAQEQQPKLIVMDIQMPEMDGLTAIRAIRSNPALEQVPIIALTALVMPGDRERCLVAGANDYLTKPVSLKQLGGTITRLLSQLAESTPSKG